MGILLDTFLVRTITVPAIAVIVGQANWWPSRFRPQVHTPVRRAERVPTPQHLTSDHHDHQTRVAVPPTVANRHRHGAHEADEQVPHHALPLFGTNGVPKQPTTNVLESAVDGQTTTNGKQPLETNGKHRAENNGNQPAETTYQQPAEAAGRPHSTPMANNQPEPPANNQSKPTANTQPKPTATTPSRRPTRPRHPKTIESMSRNGLGAGRSPMRPSRWAPATATIPPRRPPWPHRPRRKPLANTRPTPTAKNPSKLTANNQSTKNVRCLYVKAGTAWARRPWNVCHK